MRLLLIALLSCFTSALFAQDKKAEPVKNGAPQKTKPAAAFVQRTFPQPVGFVNDFSVLFESAERDSLNMICSRYEKKTGNEIVVVTIDSLFKNRQELKQFGTQLSRYWTLGKKDKNNGILVLICPETRKVRIHPGSAFKEIINEKEAETIIKNKMLPQYKDDRYYLGTKAGIEEIIRLIDERNKR